MENILDDLLSQPGIWRAGEGQQRTGLEHVASGFPELDSALPGGGWPLGALAEVFHDRTGIGELRLLMPALARLSRRGRWIALVAPPHIPYAPALAEHGIDLSRLLLVHPGSHTDALWAVEQALRAGTCGAVLAWPSRVDGTSPRRLQLAAEAGRALGLLFHNRPGRPDPSPAAIRLQIEHRDDSAVVRLLKCRGGRHGQSLALDLAAARPPEDGPAASLRNGTEASIATALRERKGPVRPGARSADASVRPGSPAVRQGTAPTVNGAAPGYGRRTHPPKQPGTSEGNRPCRPRGTRRRTSQLHLPFG